MPAHDVLLPKHKTGNFRKTHQPAEQSLAASGTQNGSLSADNLLRLQHTIGNQAVQRVIGARRTANAAAPVLPPLPALPPPALPPALPRIPSPGAISSWSKFRERALAASRDPLQLGRRQKPVKGAPTIDYTPQRDAILNPIM